MVHVYLIYVAYKNDINRIYTADTKISAQNKAKTYQVDIQYVDKVTLPLMPLKLTKIEWFDLHLEYLYVTLMLSRYSYLILK